MKNNKDFFSLLYKSFNFCDKIYKKHGDERYGVHLLCSGTVNEKKERL